MKRIAAMALCTALMVSAHMTAFAAAPETGVEPAPTAAVLEQENSLWDLPKMSTPDMSNTVWSFAGGYIDGADMTQAEMDADLAAYGGKLEFAFYADGTAAMVQGGGSLSGTWQYLNDGSVGVIFDNGGSELRYACIFSQADDGDLLMIAISDEAGEDGVYFVQ